jgi:hypothetical protein
MVKNTIFTTERLISYTFPSSWDDIDYRTFKLLNFEDKTGLFHLLTGLDKEVIENIHVYKHLDKALDKLMSVEYPKELPSRIKGVKLCDKITGESIGQYEDAKLSINQDGANAPPIVVAIYLQESKGYDYDKALLLSKEIEKMPFYIVVNAYNFFLTKSINKRTTWLSRLLLIIRSIAKRLKQLVMKN